MEIWIIWIIWIIGTVLTLGILLIITKGVILMHQERIGYLIGFYTRENTAYAGMVLSKAGINVVAMKFAHPLLYMLSRMIQHPTTFLEFRSKEEQMKAAAILKESSVCDYDLRRHIYVEKVCLIILGTGILFILLAAFGVQFPDGTPRVIWAVLMTIAWLVSGDIKKAKRKEGNDGKI